MQSVHLLSVSHSVRVCQYILCFNQVTIRSGIDEDTTALDMSRWKDETYNLKDWMDFPLGKADLPAASLGLPSGVSYLSRLTDMFFLQ